MADVRTIVDGLAFGEGPRWHDGRLWFSDMHDFRVKAVTPDGELEVICEVAGRPSGLGWDVDGNLLIVSMEDRRLLRFDGDGVSEVADLSDRTEWELNDMVVDRAGRAYIGGFGFDYHNGADMKTTSILRVDPDGGVTTAADDLLFPNGMVITDDGGTLIVGESYGARLTAFSITADGGLGSRRLFADGVVPDGICLDASGAVWVADPLHHAVIRVADGGEQLERVELGERIPVACMLGGEDRRTLFICSSLGLAPAECEAQRSGRIEATEVAVAGAGLP
jgi:sugar lactone lactonase YvrE